MRQPFYWILLTYLTRPLIWIFVAIVAIESLVFLNVGPGESKQIGYQSPHHKRVIVDRGALQQSISDANPATIAINLSSIAADRSPKVDAANRKSVELAASNPNTSISNPSYLLEPAIASRISSIDFGFLPVSQSMIDQLADFSELRHLRFFISDADQVTLDLSPLAQLLQLESVDLGMVWNVQSLDFLSQPPRLHTVAFRDHRLLSDTNLRQLADCPFLQTIYLPTATLDSGRLDHIRLLNQSSSLQHVMFADEYTSAALKQVQSQLDSIAVQSNVYLPGRQYLFLGMLWTSMLFSFLGMQCQSQFSITRSQLTPGYGPAHQRVAWTLICLGSLAMSVALVLWGATFWPSLCSMSLANLFFVLGSLGLEPAKQRSTWLPKLYRLAMGLLVFSAIATLILRPLLVERFLLACPISLLIVMSCALVTMIFRVRHRMRETCRRLLATGQPPIVTMQDARDFVAQQKLKLQAANTSPYVTEFQTLTLVSFFTLAIALAMPWLPEKIGDYRLEKPVAGLCFIAADIWVFLIGIKWWQQVPYFASLITHPPRRQTQIRQMFRGVGSDFFKMLPLLIAAGVMLSRVPIFLPMPAAIRVVVCVLALAAIAFVCCATILWALTIRSIWGVSILAALVYCFSWIAVIAALIVTGDFGQQVSALQIVAGSTILILASCLAVWTANRHYQRVEWSRLT